jgi:hypothetical protein
VVSGEKKGRKRILALGDSFTEGDGAPFDSSYVALMRGYAGDSYEIMNAGTCGCDPFNNFMNLRDRLLIFQPDVIIQSISSSDMNCDILVRGGLERGITDYSPWWEPLYEVNYTSRIFFRAFGYNELLRKNSMSEAEENRVNNLTIDSFKQYSQLCQKNHILLLIVMHPGREKVVNNKYDYDFSQVWSALSPDSSIHIIDTCCHPIGLISSIHILTLLNTTGRSTAITTLAAMI